MPYLQVDLYGKAIGWIQQCEHQAKFHVLESYYREKSHDILSISYEDRPQRIWSNNPNVRAYLPAFFENCLPEEGSPMYLHNQKKWRFIDHFELLSYIGRDLFGALDIYPVAQIPQNLPPQNHTADQSERASNGGQIPPLLSAIGKHQISQHLSGVQKKISMRISDIPDNRRFTLPLHIPDGDAILKFNNQTFPALVENEHATMLWAKKSGLDVADGVQVIDVGYLQDQLEPNIFEFLTEKNANALAILRFDRVYQKNEKTGELTLHRKHMEDFNQIFGLQVDQKYAQINPQKYTYEKIAKILAAWCHSQSREADVLEYIKRLIFMTICGNGDAHLKNWSILYHKPREVRLSPAYDFVSTVVYSGLDDCLALEMDQRRTKRFEEQQIANFTNIYRAALRDDGSKTDAQVSAFLQEFSIKVREVWREIKDLYLQDHQAKLEKHLARLGLP